MTKSQTWCDRHWQEIRDTFTGPQPINGILLSTEIIRAWVERKAEQLGGVMPGPRDTHAVNQMMANDSPLCCWLGEKTLAQLKTQCVLPAKYRHLSPNEGHVRHMAELGKADGLTIDGQSQ